MEVLLFCNSLKFSTFSVYLYSRFIASNFVSNFRKCSVSSAGGKYFMVNQIFRNFDSQKPVIYHQVNVNRAYEYCSKTLYPSRRSQMQFSAQNRIAFPDELNVLFFLATHTYAEIVVYWYLHLAFLSQKTVSHIVGVSRKLTFQNRHISFTSLSK